MMNKIFVVLVIVFLLLIGLFFWSGSNSISPELAQTFQDRMATRGVELLGGVMPIEGFDAFLLVGAFPGLEETDFDGVQSFEGVYVYENEGLRYERTASQPITSAEQTISEEGYAMLLEKVSKRLRVSVRNEQDVIDIIALLATRQNNGVISSFADCVAVGNPVMESYPRQCRTQDGRLFVEKIREDVGVFYDDRIVIDSPKPGDTISSPLTIRGSARGLWYFEATFPITLVDWDGRIIAEHFATAQGDWMTEDFVPYEGIIEFTAPDEDIFSRRGTLILQRSNASGLPEHDAALEIPIVFE